MIVACIIVLSLLLQNNFFEELSIWTNILLIVLCVSTCNLGGKKKTPSPLEIRFYGDYLVIFRGKHYYNARLTRQEYDKLYYKDIKKIEYRVRTKKVVFGGIVEGTFYNYQKDGTVSSTPSYHKTVDGISYFYTDFLRNGNIVDVIEEHSPLKVTVVDD